MGIRNLWLTYEVLFACLVHIEFEMSAPYKSNQNIRKHHPYAWNIKKYLPYTCDIRKYLHTLYMSQCEVSASQIAYRIIGFHMLVAPGSICQLMPRDEISAAHVSS